MSQEDLVATVNALASRVQVLESQTANLEGQAAVRRLQHQYGYYLDKCLYEEVVDLFARDSEVHFLDGRYLGIDGVRRLYVDRFQQRFTRGLNGPLFGFLLDHPQLQDVITVSADGKSAKARFRALMQAGVHKQARETFPGTVSADQWWEGGIYENEYVVEGGVWKIKVLKYRPVWHGEYGTGWSNQEPMAVGQSSTFPENPIGPDEVLDGGYDLFPNTEIFPFHYPHPVTGEEVVSDDDEAARHG